MVIYYEGLMDTKQLRKLNLDQTPYEPRFLTNLDGSPINICFDKEDGYRPNYNIDLNENPIIVREREPFSLRLYKEIQFFSEKEKFPPSLDYFLAYIHHCHGLSAGGIRKYMSHFDVDLEAELGTFVVEKYMYQHGIFYNWNHEYYPTPSSMKILGNVINLTQKEIEIIMDSINDNDSSEKHLAQKHFVSKHTIKNHRVNFRKKLEESFEGTFSDTTSVVSKFISEGWDRFPQVVLYMKSREKAFE